MRLTGVLLPDEDGEIEENWSKRMAAALEVARQGLALTSCIVWIQLLELITLPYRAIPLSPVSSPCEMIIDTHPFCQ